MITSDQFKALSPEGKKQILESIVLPRIATDGSQNESLERVIFQYTEEEQTQFFEALMDPEKKNAYMQKIYKEIKKNNWEIYMAKTRLQQESNILDETIDTEKSWTAEDILKSI